MENYQPETFTNQVKARAIFDSAKIRGRDPKKPWDLLPIIAFIAPPGGGKTTLIQHLVFDRAHDKTYDPHKGLKVMLPHAHLICSDTGTPKDIFSILLILKEQLQRQFDHITGKYLTFPRFDFGAAVALSPVINARGLSPTEEEVEQMLTKLAGGIIHTLGPITSAAQKIPDPSKLPPVPLPYPPHPLFAAAHGIPYLIQAINIFPHIPITRELLLRLREVKAGSGWKWYQSYEADQIDKDLRINAGISHILKHLYLLSSSNRRSLLKEQLLPAAFLADLREALDVPQPHVWSNQGNVLLFLDDFDTLCDDDTGTLLLQRLLLNKYQRGKTDALLVIVSSQQYMLNSPQIVSQTQSTAEKYVEQLYLQWQENILKKKQATQLLTLNDLYIECGLPTFELADTRTYLLKLGQLKGNPVFSDDTLVQALHTATSGYPLFVKLAAFVMLEGKSSADFSKIAEEFVSTEVASDARHKKIGEYLIGKWLDRLSEKQKTALYCCAIPRTLDSATLAAMQNCVTHADTLEKEEDWLKLFHRFPFTRTSDNGSTVLLPSIRTLLLKNINVDAAKYIEVHSCLRKYFYDLSQTILTQNNSLHDTDTAAVYEKAYNQARLEEIYHALALGDPEPAIQLGLDTKHKPTLLESDMFYTSLLSTVAQAPPLQDTKLREKIVLRAQEAHKRTEQAMQRMKRTGKKTHWFWESDSLKDEVTTNILYTWLTVPYS